MRVIHYKLVTIKEIGGQERKKRSCKVIRMQYFLVRCYDLPRQMPCLVLYEQHPPGHPCLIQLMCNRQKTLNWLPLNDLGGSNVDMDVLRTDLLKFSVEVNF